MAATAAMSAAGFLGGHLSYRLGVGVDQTTFDPKLEEWSDVMDDGELEEGRPRRVMVSGTNVFLLRTGGRIHALANRCSHRGGPLHKGAVDAEAVTCPWHLSTFRLEDGSVLRGPATAPQPAYEARVSDGKVQIRERPQDRAR
jgi:nitrite reductase/ring-hydroxylating ferredoxin subunit